LNGWLKKGGLLLAAAALSVSLAACGSADNNGAGKAENNTGNSAQQNEGAAGNNGGSSASELAGSITIDGSSTVYPVSQAVAEEFMKIHKGVNVTVSASGTGGGFEKFANGELDITGASRPQKDSEKEAAAANGIEGLELQVANDGITVVINKENDWAEEMTVEELKKLWEPAAEGKVMKWSDIREGWPDEEIHLYGPGTDSGTFDFFTGEIVGEEGASRGDYQPSEDDNVIVQGVAGDPYALGYFGYAYYLENQDTLKAVAVNGTAPSAETIEDGSYAPLSRPIFIYVKKSELERPDIQAYLKFHFTEGIRLIPEVGYIPLPDQAYRDNLAKAGIQ
jgi:phosphate transport system substrate-binding protein